MKNLKQIERESIDQVLNEKKPTKIGNFLSECYSENTFNKADLVSLNEVNARSLIDRYSKDGCVIVSPCRGGDDFGLDTEDEFQRNELNGINVKRIKELIGLIQSSGYRYTPVYGGFIENQDTESEEVVYERAFVIYNHYKDRSVGDFNDLRQFALELANKYNQDRVLVKAPDGNPEYIKKDGSLEFGFDGNVSLNDLFQVYFIDLHKSTQKTMKDGSCPTRFSFIESYINPAPQCYSERFLRDRRDGEVFISR